MEDIRKCETSELIDLLSDYTNKYTQLHPQGERGELEKIKSIILVLQEEIKRRQLIK